MNRFFILLIIGLVSLGVIGCHSTFEKRITKDIIGINEQLYELEKKQLKDSALLKKLEASGVPAGGEKEAVKAEEAPVDMNTIYKEGYRYYLEQNYTEAIKQLSLVTARFKDDSLIDNALYWQAESYLNLKKTDVALLYYQMIYRYFPFSSKADYALYKIGLIYQETNDSARAERAYKRLLDEYPESDLYKTVEIKLNQLKPKNRRK